MEDQNLISEMTKANDGKNQQFEVNCSSDGSAVVTPGRKLNNLNYFKKYINLMSFAVVVCPILLVSLVILSFSDWI